MSIDGRFLTFLGQELNEMLQQGRIQKISQLSASDFLFAIRANEQNHKLYLSLSTSNARINLTEKKYQSDYLPGGFCMFLRKHIEGGIITTISTVNHDRIMQLTVQNTNDIGDSVEMHLMMEMFSRYTNLVITDSNGKILNAYKHISPFEKADRTIANGAIYRLPEDDKISPLELDQIRDFFTSDVSAEDIVNRIRGLSPLIANYILKQASYQPSQYFNTYVDLLNKKPCPTMTLGKKASFYYLDIFDDKQKYFDRLSSLIDDYYDEASAIERVKQIHKYLLKLVKREHKKKKNKREKLYADLKQAQNHDVFRIYGDTILASQQQISRGDALLKAYAFELGTDVEIELDRLLTPVENANQYYLKYKKLKKAVKHIHHQIQLTDAEIIYLSDMIDTVTQTQSLGDLLEIQDELIDLHYISKRKKQAAKKRPNFDTYYDVLNRQIWVGKNNIQNNFLTHKLAKKNDWWFHVQGQSGSHVISGDIEQLDETLIRTAAQLAAYFSKSRHSSSVAVDYTQVKYIKKVPGMFGSYVTYTHQKTIYIDPDENFINQLKKGR